MIGPRLQPVVGLSSGMRAGVSADPIAGQAAATTTTMTVSVTPSANPVITGAYPYSYAVAVTNTGGNTATSVSCTITLDASLTYVSASGTGWAVSPSGQVITCTVASLGVGAAPTITVNVTTGASQVSASTPAAVSGSNFATANGSSSTTVNFVTKDAAARKYFPANASEWTAIMGIAGLATGNPSSVWGCQDASGSLADGIGSSPLAMTGSPTYRQAVSGYTRTAVADADSGTVVAVVAWPTTATSSAMLLAVLNVSGTPSGTRSLGGFGTLAQVTEVTAAGKLQVAVATTQLGTTSMITMGVTPMVLQYIVGTGQATGYNIADKVVPTAGARTSTTIGLGDISVVDAPCQYLYAAGFTGAAAELTSTQLKALLTTLGWSPSWS